MELILQTAKGLKIPGLKSNTSEFDDSSTINVTKT